MAVNRGRRRRRGGYKSWGLKRLSDWMLAYNSGAGISIKRFAELAGTTPGQIAQLFSEKRRRRPGLDLAVAIEACTSIRPSEWCSEYAGAIVKPPREPRPRKPEQPPRPLGRPPGQRQPEELPSDWRSKLRYLVLGPHAKMTQAEVARMVGVTKEAVAKWVYHKRTPRPAQAAKLARLLRNNNHH